MISFAGSSLFKDLRRPPRRFFLFAPLPACRGRGRRRRCLFAPGSSSVLRSSFSVPPAVRARGRAGAVFMIADLGRGFRPTCAAAEPLEREKGNPGVHGPKARGPRKKTGRSIRCPARIRPLHQARTGFEPYGKRTGASPSCLKSISRPLPSKIYPFRFALRGGCGRSCRARDNAFHPATDHHNSDSDLLQIKLQKLRKYG